VLTQATQVAATETTVLLLGESGTGKEVVARFLHRASSRNNGPFIALNCAALPEQLLEAELFGYERGAYTGATQSKPGQLEQAAGGTLFLDEVGEMSPSAQAKFLRVLQERQFYPVGSEQPVDVDVRVIVATNKNLEELVKQGLFREDLFYRIHVIPVMLPPLRDRKEDIPLLADHFLKKFSGQMSKKITGFTPPAMQLLMLHDWPGNVRELENTVEYAVAMAREQMIAADLILPAKSGAPESIKPLKEARASFEKGYLIRLLEMTRGNVSSAASLAGRYRADLYNLLKKYVINPADFKKE
jgi:two-component system response regulator GlrR